MPASPSLGAARKAESLRLHLDPLLNPSVDKLPRQCICMLKLEQAVVGVLTSAQSHWTVPESPVCRVELGSGLFVLPLLPMVCKSRQSRGLRVSLSLELILTDLWCFSTVFGLGPPAPESDAAVALTLQQEFARVGASAHDDSLEEKGLFFCQICQKNLSAMNVTRREQHVNRWGQRGPSPLPCT